MNQKNRIKVYLTSSVLALMMGTIVNADTVGTITATSVNVRQEPSTASAVIDQASRSTAKVIVPILNLRATPDLVGNNIIGKLKSAENVTILSTLGEWSYVSTPTQQVGYVFSTYLKPIATTEASLAKSSVTEDVRSQIVNYAKQFLGNPYVFGGTNLTKGIDCSSFTQQILHKFGYKIRRTSYLQIHDGTPVAYSQLLPGDLVFYGFSGIVSHVAMYIGDGKVIHASSPKTGIIISGMYSQGRKPLIGATRIIQ